MVNLTDLNANTFPKSYPINISIADNGGTIISMAVDKGIHSKIGTLRNKKKHNRGIVHFIEL